MTTRSRIDRFERVQQTREKIRDEVQVRLAEVRQREQELLDRSEGLDRQRLKALKIFSDGSSRSLDVMEIWGLRSDIDAVDEEIRRVSRTLEETREELRDLQETLEERHREAKAVENLVGSMRETYRKERLHAEQIEMDDLASVKFAFGRVGAGSR